jgi:hypothetical protein
MDNWKDKIMEDIEKLNKWKLVRERDNLTKHSRDVVWIEWGEDDFPKKRHTEPKVGRSLLMSPFNIMFTWTTTVIEEIIEEREGYIKFRTSNSVYELFKEKDK